MTPTLDGTDTEVGTGMASGSTGLDDGSTSDDSTAGAPADPGHPDGAFVSAGAQARSPGYRLVWTFGQSSQNQGTMTSPSYRLRGGLVPATQ